MASRKADKKNTASKAPLLLVVEDDPHTRMFLRDFLEGNGYHIHEAANGTDAVRRLRETAYDLVLTDLRLGDIDGLAVLQEALSQPRGTEVVLATAYGSIESAVDAIKRGAFDYLTKPFDTKRILITLQQALERGRLKREIVNLKTGIEGKYSRRHIVADSSQMRCILDLVDTVAMTDSTVLIEGESGTGKELIARAIHYGGPRAAGPFVAVNCTALPEALLESELFGHTRGAFTGALQDKKGLFEEADGGTLLLDEVGDMPPAVQPKLLRALEEGRIRRVGSNSMRSVDVRIIASTNRDLQSLVEWGKFREDLFFRLNVIPIRIPPLRERREDILPLANHFLEALRRKIRKEVRGFSPGAVEYLLGHELPGNVRELANLIERAVTICRGPELGIGDLVFELGARARPAGGAGPPARTRPLAQVNRDMEKKQAIVEREQIAKALQKSRWNRSRAARELGISRTTLWSKMQKHGIRPPLPGPEDRSDA
jgi:two-component system response regulator HydG